MLLMGVVWACIASQDTLPFFLESSEDADPRNHVQRRGTPASAISHPFSSSKFSCRKISVQYFLCDISYSTLVMPLD
ncbi:hypothetical protein BDW62DRAFT_183154 [Aspergillus aurantiobrunneus]